MPLPAALSRFAREAALQTVRTYLATALRSSDWRIIAHPKSRNILTGHGPQWAETPGAIVAFWHQTLPLMPRLWWWAQPQNPTLTLRFIVSRNADGRLINDIVAPWNIHGIAGSTAKRGKDKGGARALREAIAALRHGHLVGITPDGPRGPARQAAPGILTLARLANRPIIPLGSTCTSLTLPSWDRMAFPLPLGQGRFVCLPPLPPNTDLPTLEAALNDAQTRAIHAYERARSRPIERLWAATGEFIAPALILMLRRRLAIGREDGIRRRERLGLTRLKRPRGPLLWLHAASVGESVSLRPLLDALLQADPARTLLVTTATVTGANIIVGHATKHPGRILHQYIPFDVPRWTTRFLNHWQPDIALFTESELWPGLLAACRKRAIPTGLINARLSDRSWKRWQRLPAPLRHFFKDLDLVAARSPEDAARFTALGTPTVVCHGDLKAAAPPLPADPNALAALRAILGNRPVFLAASTHPGEEDILQDAANRLLASHPTLLTIIVPRHPPRGAEIAARLANAPRRSQNATPTAQDRFWIADTLGELGLFYRTCPIAFIGNSLIAPGGGHNPYEPAQFGVALCSGPHTNNFRDIFARLNTAVSTVHTAPQLADWIATMLNTPAIARQHGHTAQTIAQHAEGCIEALSHHVTRLLAREIP